MENDSIRRERQEKEKTAESRLRISAHKGIRETEERREGERMSGKMGTKTGRGAKGQKWVGGNREEARAYLETSKVIF